MPPKEANPIPPIPFGSFLEEILESADQPADIRGWNRLVINEYDASVITIRLRPRFQQRRDGLPVIGDKSEFLRGCLLKKQIVGQTQEAPAFPLGKIPNNGVSYLAAKTFSDVGRDLLVKQEL
jgi:hypothetical protein